MSEESLDYLKLCPNYYTNWEDGCCMESCTINDMNECPIHYVKGLLEEKDKAIESWETMYKSVMQTCHNDKEEIERLNKQLKNLQQEQIKEMQEHQEAMELADKTITNLVEDNRASQEWYKKQLAESESRFQAHKQNDARIIQDQTDLIENLRQQLSDTEEQNKRVLEKLELIVSANQELEQKLAESKNSLKRTIEHYEKYCSEINHQNVMLYASAFNAQQASRDKISFCIEQLEKVKEFFLKEHRDEEMDTDYIITKDAGEIADYLLNQIERLKEGK